MSITYIKYGYFGQILQSFPLSSEVLHTAHNDHVFELMIMEVGGSERHHQVPQTNQRGVRVSKQTDNNMAIEDSHGGLVTVLQVYRALQWGNTVRSTSSILVR